MAKWSAKDFETNNKWSAEDFNRADSTPKYTRTYSLDELGVKQQPKDTSKIDESIYVDNQIPTHNNAGLMSWLYNTPIGSRIGSAMGGINIDGTPIRPIGDAGKIGNFIGDLGGSLLGLKAMDAGTGGVTGIFGATDKLANDALAKYTGNTVDNLPKLTENALSKYNSKIAKIVPKLVPYGIKAATDAVDMGTFNGVNASLQGQDVAKSVGEGLLQGAVLGPATKGLGELPKGLKVLGNNAVKTKVTQDIMPGFDINGAELPKVINEVAVTKKPISGKFTVKNTLLDKAINEYDNAVKAIQNDVGHYKLTEDEILNSSIKLGIDPFKLLDNIDESSKGIDIRKVGNDAKWKQIAGLGNEPRPLHRTNNIKPTLEPLPDKPSIGATDRTQSMARIVSSDEAKTKKTLSDRWDRFYTRFVDTNSPIKKVDERTYIKATNSKNVGGTIDYILQDGLVDRQGKKIGESLKNIVKEIPESEETDFMNYVLQKHNIDRAREESIKVPKVDKQGFLVKDKNGNQLYDTVVTKKSTPVFTDFTSEQSQKAIDILDQKYPQYKQLNDRLIKFIRDFNQEWGNNSGLIEDDLWKSLQDTYKNYVPTQRAFTELEQGVSKTNGRGFVDQHTPLNKATGSDRDVINPVENIMNMVNRTVRTAKYNEVGQELLNATRKNPGLNELVRIIPTDEAINSNAKNIVSVLENGKPVNLEINDKNLLGALESIHKANVGDVEKVFKKVTNGFKSLITTKNPVFAVRNIFRDIPTYLINSTENNPIKAIGNLAGAVKDIATNSETYQQYKALGGGGSNFFNPEKVAKNYEDLIGRKPILSKEGDVLGYKNVNPIKKTLKAVGEKVEKLNNITEAAPRLAEFKNSLGKGNTLDQAMFDAADVTTNFSRGGDIIKKGDSYIPYLNAGFQGFDKTVRQFKDRPIATILKGATIITAPTLILNHINKDNPNYKGLDNRTKDNYFLIPKDDGTFFKIPKSREFGVIFSTLTERILRQLSGEQDSFKGFVNTAKNNFGPANPIENNILSPLAYNIPVNKDFADRSIVPENMKDRSPKYQYDEFTSEIGKKIGELTNISPKQVDYLIKAYTGVIGQLALPATTKRNYTSGTPIEKILKPVTSQFVADPLYNNSAISDFYDNFDKLKQAAADKNFTEQIPSKRVTEEEKTRNKFTKASEEISKLSKEAKEAEKLNQIEQLKKIREMMIQKARETNNLLKR